MDYFIRRKKYVNSTDDVLTMLYEIIPQEMLVRQGAPRYGVEITMREVDKLLCETARVRTRPSPRTSSKHGTATYLM